MRASYPIDGLTNRVEFMPEKAVILAFSGLAGICPFQ